MDPQDYSARTGYRPPAAWYRRLNHLLGPPLVRAGLSPRDAVVLEVRGRTTGRRHRTPLLRTRYQGEDYLVALAGEAQWVRNVRAASGDAVLRRRGARRVHLDEVPDAERGAVIAEYLRQCRRRSSAAAGAKQARYYFGLPPDPSPDEIAAVAPYYPVLHIRYEN